jgi:hypothetical protein
MCERIGNQVPNGRDVPDAGTTVATATIVPVHGGYADGSSWKKVISRLQQKRIALCHRGGALFRRGPAISGAATLSPIRTFGPLLTSGLVSGCSVGGAPSFELFGAFFPAWLFCGVIGLVGAGTARGVFVATGLSNLLPYQLFVCTAVGITAACLAWLFGFGS